MRGTFLCSLIAVIAVVAVVVAQPAHAQTPDAKKGEQGGAGAQSSEAQSEQDEALARAKELFKQAEVQFGLGKFDEALELYQKAYEAKSLPAFHFNMAQCHRNRKRYEKAIFHFRQFLALSTDDRYRARAEDLLRDCRAKLEEQRASEEKKPAASAPADSDRGTKRKKGLSAAYFWVGVGLTGVLVATGTITGAMALSKSSTYRDPTTPVSDRPDLKDSGETLRTAANISFGAAAGAAVLTGILLFFTDFGGGDETMRAGPTNDGAMLTLTGRF